MNTLFDKIWDAHVVQKVEDGPTGSTHVRLSYAASMSDLEVGFERLGDFVASLRR